MGRFAHFLYHKGSKLGRTIQRFALSQVEQDIGDFFGMFSKIQSGDNIRLVFLFGQRRRLFIRRLFRQGVYGQTAGPFVGGTVGMNGEEKVRFITPGDFDTIAQRNKNVAVTGHINLITVFVFQMFLEFAGHGQSYVFFIYAGDTDCSGINAAMPGIEDDDFFRLVLFG